MKSKIESQIKGRKAVSHLLQGTRKGDSLQAAMWRHQRPVAGARHGEAHPEIKPRQPKASAFPPPPAPPAPAAQNHPLMRIWRNYPKDGLIPAWHPSSRGILLRSGQGGAGAVRGTSTGPPRCQTRSFPREKQPSLGDTTQCPESSLAATLSSLPWQKSPKSTCKRSSKAQPRCPSPPASCVSVSPRHEPAAAQGCTSTSQGYGLSSGHLLNLPV